MSDQPPAPPPSQPSGPPPGYPQGPPQQGYGQPARTNGLAIASMILGIVWLCWLGSILAVIFGHVALGQIKNSGGTQTGRGFAIAGLILGYLGVVTLILSLIFGEWTFDVGGIEV